ncbi:MAG: hypothetical protein ACJAY7_001747 [Pseudohongiellaceae bacterium]|jgi:hypothetical protein
MAISSTEQSNKEQLMGFLGRIFRNVGTSAYRKEIEHYRDFVRGMDSEELGSLLALSFHIGNGLSEVGWPIHDPMSYQVSEDSKLSVIYLRQIYSQFQKQGQNSDAAALAIWLHTFRAVMAGEIRYIAKECWAELARGRPYVQAAAESMSALTGKSINYSGYQNFPVGFDQNS